MLPALVGDVNPIRWAWEPQAEHRWLPSRLAFVSLYRLTGDLAPCMVLNVLGSAAVAALLIQTARAEFAAGRRSATSFSRSAFLHLGHWENWLWSSQIGTTPRGAPGGGAIVSLTAIGIASRGSAVTAAVTIAALPLCGAPGLAFGVPGAVRLGVVAFRLRQEAPGPGGRFGCRSGRGRGRHRGVIGLTHLGVAVRRISLDEHRSGPGFSAGSSVWRSVRRPSGSGRCSRPGWRVCRPHSPAGGSVGCGGPETG